MSKKLKLSPWHDGSVKPVHVGVYEGKDDNLLDSYFSYWDGFLFNGWWNTKEKAIKNMRFGNPYYCISKWRGILK